MNNNFAEGVAQVAPTHDTLRSHFKIRVFEFRVPRDYVECSRKTTCHCAQQQILRCPHGCETTKLGWRTEMDYVGCGIGLGNASPPRRPPRSDVISVRLLHLFG